MPTPEEEARERIDQLLDAAGWRVQDRNELNLGAALGMAGRGFPLTMGFSDYLLFVKRRPIGVVEAKAMSTPLSGVDPAGARRPPGPG
jgi:type I restriction enzyme R subunit